MTTGWSLSTRNVVVLVGVSEYQTERPVLVPHEGCSSPGWTVAPRMAGVTDVGSLVITFAAAKSSFATGVIAWSRSLKWP